jgi:RNAse (barnase) inhibitor barstar
LKRFLTEELEPNVYQLQTEVSIEYLSKNCETKGFQFFYINGNQVSNKETFLNEFALSLQFPDYFGNNWDALEDCLTDLEWVSAQGYVIFYEDAGNFTQQHPQDWKIALDVLSSAVEFWQKQDIPMYVLIKGSGDAIAQLPLLT